MVNASCCCCVGSAAKKAEKRRISFRQRADKSDIEEEGSSDHKQSAAEREQGPGDAIEEDAEPVAPSSSKLHLLLLLRETESKHTT